MLPAGSKLLDRVRRALAAFKVAAAAVQQARAEASPENVLQLRALNDRLLFAERAFITPEGLPGRAWFKHVVFSPGEHNAYGSEKFPGVTDALAVGNERLAELQANVLAERIWGAAAILGGVPPGLFARGHN